MSGWWLLLLMPVAWISTGAIGYAAWSSARKIVFAFTSRSYNRGWHAGYEKGWAEGWTAGNAWDVTITKTEVPS